MRYLSICSGIEAATIAWHPLGFTPAGFSEIEAFPRAVLEHRFGAVPVGWDHRHDPQSNTLPLFGDFTKIEAHHVGPIDLLVGGTPCQSFSVAGKRLGLDDPRGHLTLEYLALARRLRPRWLVWENVPGVLSDDGGRTLGTFLALVGQLGYRWAYRVLDAQYCRVDGFGQAVPQRRRRVFVVGHLGDDARAAAVLFDRESLRGDPAPRREAGQGVAHDVAPSLVSSGRGVERCGETRGQDPVVAEISHCLNAGGMGRRDYETETFVAHALRGEGFDASEDGTGRGTPLVAFSCKDSGNDMAVGLSPTLRAMGGTSPNGGGQVAVAFDLRGREGGSMPEGPHDTANVRAAPGGSSRSYVAEQWAVRRLTPRECERLQGFPDGHTAILWRGKPADQCPDGPRYKAIGNSMAVNVMRWIGERIKAVDAIAKQDQAA